MIRGLLYRDLQGHRCLLVLDKNPRSIRIGDELASTIDHDVYETIGSYGAVAVALDVQSCGGPYVEQTLSALSFTSGTLPLNSLVLSGSVVAASLAGDIGPLRDFVYAATYFVET